MSRLSLAGAGWDWGLGPAPPCVDGETELVAVWLPFSFGADKLRWLQDELRRLLWARNCYRAKTSNVPKPPDLAQPCINRVDSAQSTLTELKILSKLIRFYLHI